MFEKWKQKKKLKQLEFQKSQLEVEKTEFLSYANACLEGGFLNLRKKADAIINEFNEVAENSKKGIVMSQDAFNEMYNYSLDDEEKIVIHYNHLEIDYSSLIENPLLNEEEKEEITKAYDEARKYVKNLLHEVEKSMKDCQAARNACMDNRRKN